VDLPEVEQLCLSYHQLCLQFCKYFLIVMYFVTVNHHVPKHREKRPLEGRSKRQNLPYLTDGLNFSRYIMFSIVISPKSYSIKLRFFSTKQRKDFWLYFFRCSMLIKTE